ncbi:hypothetical protein DERP_010181 [Dermatophagoides pteronyssinus]|uniref:Uncharacterized protein n=1 Tax=Dermatophagoides pteronyssinus TaxID=6956 RepID=A0ABQ8J6Z3_DERPT|nr:hypothetical protein DERP_010181 [Dermatophagoides pteronyssinus]
MEKLKMEKKKKTHIQRKSYLFIYLSFQVVRPDRQVILLLCLKGIDTTKQKKKSVVEEIHIQQQQQHYHCQQQQR